jgi:hypothetical protein
LTDILKPYGVRQVLTIDKCQGIDCDIVLLSCAKWTAEQNNLLKDPRVKFYEPAELSIRRSAILLNWGMFLLKAGEEPRLAFESNVSGAQNLLSDFVALAESVQDTFELAEG